MLPGDRAGQEQKGYILLAEDDDDDVEMLTNFLRDLPEPPEVLVLNKGDKVISFFENLSEKNLPRLIILDYNLPTVSGYEILSALTVDKKYLSIPKIVWSTSGSSHFEKQCLARGADAYFVKPADLLGFQVLVQKLLQFLSIPTR
jgi:CheY-like chemotaxis protein